MVLLGDEVRCKGLVFQPMLLAALGYRTLALSWRGVQCLGQLKQELSTKKKVKSSWLKGFVFIFLFSFLFLAVAGAVVTGAGTAAEEEEEEREEQTTNRGHKDQKTLSTTPTPRLINHFHFYYIPVDAAITILRDLHGSVKKVWNCS